MSCRWVSTLQRLMMRQCKCVRIPVAGTLQVRALS